MEKKQVALIASFIAVFALSLSFIVSFVLWRGGSTGVRRVFIFERYLPQEGAINEAEEGMTSGARPKSKERPLSMEARYIAKNSTQGAIKAYVDDLLLGPVTHGSCPLFAAGTRANSCFVRNGVLYVNLNDALLNVNSLSSDIRTAIMLLKKNVMRNFFDIKDVLVFVNGEEAFKSLT